MQFLVKQKYFTLRDSFTISDSAGTPRYSVFSKIFTLPKKFWIKDAHGQELLYMRARFWTILPKFEMFKGEQKVGYIQRRIALFVQRYKVETPLGVWKVKGNVFAWTFDIYDESGKHVGIIDKKILHIADTYAVQTDDDRNNDYVMAVALCIDAWHHRNH